MSENSLAISFVDSLKTEVVSSISDFREVGLDAILENGLLKDIPFVSMAVSLYRVGRNIAERHYVKKLAIFLNEINNHIVDEEKRQEYINKIKKDSQFFDKELEYLLILIDRYISDDKPQMLAKLYLAYLDNMIVWDELVMYAEIIDRLLLLDYGTLVSDVSTFIVHRNIGGESILRLVALGLMTETVDKTLFKENGRGGFSLTWEGLVQSQSVDKIYIKTEFGEKLANILKK